MERIRDLPISVKALAAWGVLLISLLCLGAETILTLDRSSGRLDALVQATLPKQIITEELGDQITDAHIRLFRYTAWAANGVDGRLLGRLASDILSGNMRVKVDLARLAGRDDLTGFEAEQVRFFRQAWTEYARASKEAIAAARTDPAKATAMLGGADDAFQAAEGNLQRLAAAARTQTRDMASDLRSAAQRDARRIQLGGLAALFASLVAALLFARSIVSPIRSVTAAMREISFGNLDFEPARVSRGRRDEIGQMVAAIDRFCSDMRCQKELIEKREDELRTQNLRFNAALSNMSQGLSMFDGNRQLIVCNERYAEVYGLPRDLIRPGTTQREILECRVALGIFAGGDPQAYIRSRVENASTSEPSDQILELSDGRIVAIARRPMAGGGWVSTHEDITERRRAEARIAHLATHDCLTALPNRILFRQRLEEALAALRPGQAVAVHCLDLDRFKAVNDTLGHPVGDLLLEAVSARLRRCVREGDTVARLSGDEFAIVQAGIARPEEAESLAARLVDAVREPYFLDGHRVSVGASVGTAMANEAGGPPDELLRNADTALYRAKADGRGAHRLFEPGMDETLQHRRALERDLRNAVAHGGFEVHYQPIINLATEAISGFEALLRWNRPGYGEVPPGAFIPVAEETGLIEPLGRWVLHQACREAAQWPDGIRVAVNLSPVQFAGANLVDEVRAALAEARLAPGRLELEITETVLLQDGPSTLAKLNDLRQLGVRIAIDDFGAGDSSLAHLRRFPFDRIKIDRSFISELPESGDCAAIVRAMTDLGGNLGMPTTAEGVESRAQLDHLKLQGCSEAQGFLFSRATPARDVPGLLARWPGARIAA
ncbi:EAL domain-containing protein [Propylenella binzhouense]|uniref:EAL domain-containing protein n=1 Tax=Propylenella binzhouense TaxID=2555902 RepID=A0A964WUE5_9HYPH|nr:EAL domain-containing protein [Propylenella binzhouense]MYZ48949.1 EAL domain-containing protein [Propylenella binzhouense]